MKRSYIKRSMKPLKRKHSLTRRSDRYKLILRCEKLLKQIILKERGAKCEWCKKNKVMQMAHILPKGLHPRLRFHRRNILLLCFYCHLIKWHRHPLNAAKFLIKYKGQNYESELLVAEIAAPKITIFRLKTLEVVLKHELEEL